MFTIICALTGDSAEADDFEAALLAAATLCDDAVEALPTQGRHRAARESVVIAEDGTYAGIATALAREGFRHPLSAEWSR